MRWLGLGIAARVRKGGEFNPLSVFRKSFCERSLLKAQISRHASLKRYIHIYTYIHIYIYPYITLCIPFEGTLPNTIRSTTTINHKTCWRRCLFDAGRNQGTGPQQLRPRCRAPCPLPASKVVKAEDLARSLSGIYNPQKVGASARQTPFRPVSCSHVILKT